MKLFGDEKSTVRFGIGIVLGFLLSVLCALGAMTAAEYKDWIRGEEWKWKAWWHGILGGAVGQVVQILFIWLLWK